MKTDTYDQRAAKVAAAAQAYAKAARADRPRGQVEVELLQAVADLIGVGVQRIDESGLEPERV